jgi:hypothetical protein
MTPTDHRHTPREERAIREAALDETIEGSFPASDPPSTIPNPDDHAALHRREERDGPAPVDESSPSGTGPIDGKGQ